jgi:patatin-related protein
MTYQPSQVNGEAPQHPEFTREFRLGLVLYGGVSLAIYMNGVCREFYEAVRGRGVYKLLKAITDSDIVVDIISGTSAGGINGVLLAYTLANSSKERAYEFKDFATIWRESGNINSLLRQPGQKQRFFEQDVVPINSIFDGDDYQIKLTRAFTSCHAHAQGASAPTRTENDWLSDFDELDLFVTGTDVRGRVSRYFDNTGKLIEVKDHHSVFELKHRKKRAQWDESQNWEPFKPVTVRPESPDNDPQITQNA